MTSVFQLETVNLELTTVCPLRCAQCYCTLEGGTHLDLEIAKHRVDEAAALGAKVLLLSGGETMCYPHLYELVQYSSAKIKDIKIAISGCLFDTKAFEKLVSSGVTEISVSLNGSTPEINSLTRDGYDFAISALRLLQKKKYPNTVINWVMHSNNADDFPNMISLAEKFEVKEILILGLKPNSRNEIDSFPSQEQIINTSNYLRHYSGNVRISIETCYSIFLAYHRNTRLFGNFNNSEKYKGCGAGINGLSVTVFGELTPCRHILINEAFESMNEYWTKSQVLNQLRNLADDTRSPCDKCVFRPYCRHCAAINWQINHELYIGFDRCPLYTEQPAQA